MTAGQEQRVKATLPQDLIKHETTKYLYLHFAIFPNNNLDQYNFLTIIKLKVKIKMLLQIM